MGTRREFFEQIVAVVGGAALVTLPKEAHAKTVAVKLDQVSGLKNVGGSVILKLKGREILLIRDSSASVKAMSPLCTHLACYVSYNPKTRLVDCGCHQSSFDLNGKVIGGPAKKPLETYRAELDGDRIKVKL